MPRPFKELRDLDVAKVADDMAADMTSPSTQAGSKTA